jgi:hypothetical protein
VNARAAVLTIVLAGALVGPLGAQERITIPAVASIVGVAPFYSDVRIANTSYTSPVDVTATYRCFLGSCTASASPLTFTLSPRQSRAFDDMIAAAFGAPNSAGGVELALSGGAPASTIVVTSRLYSTSPTPTVGMFIPGMSDGEAHRRSVLTQIANGGPGRGFRTNVGAFNGTDAAATATFAVYWEGFWVGEVVRTIPPHSGVQVNDVFGPGGIDHALLETSDAVVTVQTDGPPVFAYAAVIDNATTDPIFVSGEEDVAPVLSVAGTFDTRVTLVPDQNTCGSVTVQDNPTTVAQTPGSHTLTLTHAGFTYTGTVQDDGSFATPAQDISAGGSRYTVTITGTFDHQGFQARVRIDQTAPAPACSYSVDWVGLRQAGANFFP